MVVRSAGCEYYATPLQSYMCISKHLSVSEKFLSSLHLPRLLYLAYELVLLLSSFCTQSGGVASERQSKWSTKRKTALGRSAAQCLTHTRARARPVFITSLFPPSLVFVSRLTLQSLSPLNQRRNRNHKPHYVYHHQTSEQCDAAVKLWTYSGGTDFEPRPGYSYIHQVCIYRRCAQTFDQKQDWTDITASLPIVICLTFWRRNYFLNFSTPVYKIIIQEPNTLEFWNKLHFEEKKRRVHKIFKTYIYWINI